MGNAAGKMFSKKKQPDDVEANKVLAVYETPEQPVESIVPVFSLSLIISSILVVIRQAFAWGKTPQQLDALASHIQRLLRLEAPLSPIDHGHFSSTIFYYQSAYNFQQPEHDDIRPIIVKLTTVSEKADQFALVEFNMKTKREIDLYFKLDHPNIINAIANVQVRHPAYSCHIGSFISMEHLPTSLYTILLKENTVNWTFTQMWPLIRKLASALAHLLRLQIVHHDISAENILLDYPPEMTFVEALACDRIIIKIGSFSGAREYSFPPAAQFTTALSATSSPPGNPLYMPVEIKAHLTKTKTTHINPYLHDSYAFGLTIAMMILGRSSVLQALDAGRIMYNFWYAHIRAICKVKRLRQVKANKENLAKVTAFDAIGDLLKLDYRKRRFVNDHFVAFFEPL